MKDSWSSQHQQVITGSNEKRIRRGKRSSRVVKGTLQHSDKTYQAISGFLTSSWTNFCNSCKSIVYLGIIKVKNNIVHLTGNSNWILTVKISKPDQTKVGTLPSVQFCCILHPGIGIYSIWTKLIGIWLARTTNTKYAWTALSLACFPVPFLMFILTFTMVVVPLSSQLQPLVRLYSPWARLNEPFVSDLCLFYSEYIRGKFWAFI